MLFRRKKKHHHRMPPRNSKGRFTKRARAHARKARRSLKRRRRAHAIAPHRRRRRSNPMPVLMANPHRRRRRRSHQAHHAHSRRRRRNGRRHLHARGRRVRRRKNPMRLSLRGIGGIIRAALWGGAGVAAARIGGYLWTKWGADHVKDHDPTSWKTLASEVLRILSMGGLVVAVDRLALKHAPKSLVREIDRMAFTYAGLGEAGRQTIGLVVKRLKPSADLEKYGLGAWEEVMQAEDGTYYGLKDGAWYELRAGGMAGLTSADTFSGLTSADTFMGELVPQEALLDESSYFADDEAA